MKVQRRFDNSEANHFKLPRIYQPSSDSESSLQSLKNVVFYKLKSQNDKHLMSQQDRLIEFLVALRDIEKPRLYRILNKNTKLFQEFSRIVEGVNSEPKQAVRESNNSWNRISQKSNNQEPQLLRDVNSPKKGISDLEKNIKKVFDRNTNTHNQ